MVGPGDRLYIGSGSRCLLRPPDVRHRVGGERPHIEALDNHCTELQYLGL